VLVQQPLQAHRAHLFRHRHRLPHRNSSQVTQKMICHSKLKRI
jgi:hypothetical protein